MNFPILLQNITIVTEVNLFPCLYLSSCEKQNIVRFFGCYDIKEEEQGYSLRTFLQCVSLSIFADLSFSLALSAFALSLRLLLKGRILYERSLLINGTIVLSACFRKAVEEDFCHYSAQPLSNYSQMRSIDVYRGTTVRQLFSTYHLI